MRSKIHSYLGFSKRSRNLLSGYNSCHFGMERGNVKFMLLATDLAENTTKKCISTAVSQEIPYRYYGTMESLSNMTGEPNRGIYGITDVQLAKVIMEEIDKEQKTEIGKNKE